MMLYEKCVQKKLRSLFEYLDVDNDGVITSACLLNGLSRLHSNNTLDGSLLGCDITSSGHNNNSNNNNIININDGDQKSGEDVPDMDTSQLDERSRVLQANYCEYSIEELIRSVPTADANGAITLKSFLEAEATLLPRLTHLKLLQ